MGDGARTGVGAGRSPLCHRGDGEECAHERTAGRSVWREFSLGLVLVILFLVTWIAHGIAEWQTYTDEQRSHGESTQAGDFVAEFSQSTLENWQSEFLQLFAFVSLAALYIHKGSAESKDGEEKIEASLRRIDSTFAFCPRARQRSSANHGGCPIPRSKSWT